MGWGGREQVGAINFGRSSKGGRTILDASLRGWGGVKNFTLDLFSMVGLGAFSIFWSKGGKKMLCFVEGGNRFQTYPLGAKYLGYSMFAILG